MKQEFRAPARAALRFLSAANNQVHQNATMRNCATSGKTCGTAFLILWLISLVNCSGSRNSMGSIAPVVAVAPYSSTTTITTPQSHAINSTFGTPLMALVTSNGLPASGVAVNFAAPTTGASGTFAGKSSATATTDANGIATPPAFTANGIEGVYNVTASAPSAPVLATFSLTNTGGAPSIITATAGSGQSAAVNNSFANPLQVTVLDSGHNPVSNAVVVFVAPAVGASGTFSIPSGNSASSCTATTNASGVATSSAFVANGTASPYANGAVAPYSVTAAVAGISNNATFSLTNLPGLPNSVTATSGTPQSVIAGNKFASLSVLVVDQQSNPVPGVSVTFKAPATGASGTFQDTGTNTTSSTTDSSGVAISTQLTANSTAGTYSVTASATAGSATFTLTNWPTGSKFFAFYLGGQEHLNQGNAAGFYALAGSVLIGPTGNVLAGEQDYNDGFLFFSPQPSGDAITGGTLKVNSTSQNGTLTLITNNLNLGVAGTETLGIQFVNSDHALISQYDGTATSSGSLDLQTLPFSLSKGVNNGNPMSYAFTLTGIDPFQAAVGYGGVFTITSGTNLQNGLVDTNDSGIPAVTTGLPFTGTLSLPDTFGRGTITSTLNYTLTGTTTPVALNYYIVGPEVIRIIDVDTSDSAVGSAYGQGASPNFSKASLGTSVFGLTGNTYFLSQYGTVGMFTTSSGPGTFSGVADDNELSYGISLSALPISGSYSVTNNGYGSFTIPSGILGDVSSLGLYITDPALNLLDPNNTGNPGGALLADMDIALAGGTGIVIPQTNTSTASFNGNYAIGGQDQNEGFVTGNVGEFDFVGAVGVTSGAMQGKAIFSDPFLTLGTKPTDSGSVSGTPQADTSNVGRYTLLSTNSTPNPLVVTIGGTPGDFDVAMYQANGDQLFWLEEDSSSVFFGSLQQFGSFTPPRTQSRIAEQRR